MSGPFGTWGRMNTEELFVAVVFITFVFALFAAITGWLVG